MGINRKRKKDMSIIKGKIDTKIITALIEIGNSPYSDESIIIPELIILSEEG